MDWNRTQALELQIAMLQAEVRHVMEERDSARRIAVQLEQELAHVVHVPYRGEAS